jgi:tetratricopeptide (TPR) repeat protein
MNSPSVHLWPIDPQANSRALEAARKGDLTRAAFWFELAAHQPQPVPASQDLFYALLAANRPDSACQVWRDLHKARAGDDRATSQLVFMGTCVPLPETDATRLVKLAEGQVARERTASHLHHLGAALYRAGKYREAASTLEEAIKVQGKGGFIDTLLFLAMTCSRLGQQEEARKLLDAFERWLRTQKFDNARREVHWNRLREEARTLILRMPRVPEGQ